MANKYDVYKCQGCEADDGCDTLVMLLNVGNCLPFCCGKEMVALPEQEADSSTEKHVPVITKTDKGFEVVVGSTPHPMLEKHWIQWIELIIDGERMLAELNPGDEPKAFFPWNGPASKISAREYCNIHGLWKGDNS